MNDQATSPEAIDAATDAALENYCADGREIDTDWFAQASDDDDEGREALDALRALVEEAVGGLNDQGHYAENIDRTAVAAAMLLKTAFIEDSRLAARL